MPDFSTDRRSQQSSRPKSWVAILVVCVSVAIASVVHGAEPIAVAVTGGRVFAGLVDARSDDAHLLLRIEQPGITLRRQIAWNDIVLVQLGSRQLSSDELHAKLDELKTPEEHPKELPSQTVAGPERSEELPAPKPREWIPDTRLSHFIESNRINNTRVCWISIDAQVAHFSPTVESTGIILHLYPMDDMGRVVPVDGTLNVELIAGLSYVPRAGTSLPLIGSWALRVTPDQFGPAGAIIKLPFQAVQPDFNLRTGPYGLVHARLSLPGNGSFEASQSMLRIRPYSAVRDQQQQINGQRFFDVESVNRW